MPVSGPDARPYLVEATAGCDRGAYEVIAITPDAAEVQGYIDRGEVDAIVVADPGHRDELHASGLTPRVELASEIPPPPSRWPRLRWRR